MQSVGKKECTKKGPSHDNSAGKRVETWKVGLDLEGQFWQEGKDGKTALPEEIQKLKNIAQIAICTTSSDIKFEEVIKFVKECILSSDNTIEHKACDNKLDYRFNLADDWRLVLGEAKQAGIVVMTMFISPHKSKDGDYIPGKNKRDYRIVKNNKPTICTDKQFIVQVATAWAKRSGFRRKKHKNKIILRDMEK